jgi:hypothetical protein
LGRWLDEAYGMPAESETEDGEPPINTEADE